MSDTKAIQKRIGELAKSGNHTSDPKIILLFLMEELGEVVRAYMKEEGHKESNDRIVETFRQEMGDVFFLFLHLAHVTDTDLEAELEKTIKKLEGPKK